jgi:hypothetical protein
MAAESKQLALKPQDLALLLKLACHPQISFTYAQLSAQLEIAASQIHSSFKRLTASRLVSLTPDGPEIVRSALKDFVLFGARYCFPAVSGSVTRGLPTSYAAAPLKDLIIQGDDLPPVWPTAKGEVRGVGLIPLYPAAPDAAIHDEKFYQLLVLFDGLRSGAARERELSSKLLAERL